MNYKDLNKLIEERGRKNPIYVYTDDIIEHLDMNSECNILLHATEDLKCLIVAPSDDSKYINGRSYEVVAYEHFLLADDKLRKAFNGIPSESSVESDKKYYSLDVPKHTPKFTIGQAVWFVYDDKVTVKPILAIRITTDTIEYSFNNLGQQFIKEQHELFNSHRGLLEYLTSACDVLHSELYGYKEGVK